MDMNYCMHCGTRLQMKQHDTEGLVPWCESCQAFRYPVFNTAVSLLVMDRSKSKVILIRQYGRPHYILVAGYVNRGEDAEDAARRELREEMALEAVTVQFNHSHYYAPTNTLMLNFTVTVDEEEAHPNWEVDAWRWFSFDEARAAIRPGSLAEAFLLGALDGTYRFPVLKGDIR